MSLVVQIFYHSFDRVDKALRWFDALGLAAFTIIGAQAAISRGMNAPIVLLMGAITSVAGGMMRDIVCRKIPLVLQKRNLHHRVYYGQRVLFGVAEPLGGPTGFAVFRQCV